jgi:hypothetical protein
MSKRNGSKGLYKRVLALKDNGSEPDPEVPGLTYEARMTKTGIRVTAPYGVDLPRTEPPPPASTLGPRPVFRDSQKGPRRHLRPHRVPKRKWGSPAEPCPRRDVQPSQALRRNGTLQASQPSAALAESRSPASSPPGFCLTCGRLPSFHVRFDNALAMHTTAKCDGPRSLASRHTRVRTTREAPLARNWRGFLSKKDALDAARKRIDQVLSPN